MHIEEEPQYSDGGHVDTGVKDKTTNDLASKFKAKKKEEPKEKEVKPDPIEAEFEEITEPEEEVNEYPSGIDWSKSTIPAIKKALDKYGLDYPSSAKKDELIGIAEDFLAMKKEMEEYQEELAHQEEPQDVEQDSLLG